MREQNKVIRESGLSLGDRRDVWAALTSDPWDLSHAVVPTFQAFILTDPRGWLKCKSIISKPAFGTSSPKKFKTNQSDTNQDLELKKSRQGWNSGSW